MASQPTPPGHVPPPQEIKVFNKALLRETNGYSNKPLYNKAGYFWGGVGVTLGGSW